MPHFASDRRAARFRRALSFSLALAWAAACDATPGAERAPRSFPVTGILEGTVLYLGPRPACRYEAGEPAEVLGNVVLFLFEYDNPPPPSGSAASAVSFLLVPGRDLFVPSDCLPQDPSAEDLSQVVSRSAGFVWPSVPLARGEGAEVAYQIRAFYDRDADFNPFFSVSRGPSRGDVAGGAFEVVGAEPPVFRRIVLGSVEDNPLGQRLVGVSVALGAPVSTEPPLFRLHEETVAMASDAVVPSVPSIVDAERLLWELTKLRLVAVDPTSGPFSEALAAAGLSFDPGDAARGFFIEPVDADGDGMQDLHPVLGARGIPWYFPIVLLRRARTVPELLGGVPNVVLVGTVRLTQVLGGKKVFHPELDVAVAPVAVAYLDARDPACRVPIIPPGALAETYERVPVDCQEVPTGNYDVVVLQGKAGAEAVNLVARLMEENDGWSEDDARMAASRVTDTGWLLEGGSFSGQNWSVPNELGCQDELYDPNPVSELDADPGARCRIDLESGSCDAAGTKMLCEQGPSGRFAVADPDLSDAPDPDDFRDGHGTMACQRAIAAGDMMERAIAYMPVPAACCESVRHLCGLPLCEARPIAARATSGGSRMVRQVMVEGEDYEVDASGKVTLKCVPFLPPASCCR